MSTKVRKLEALLIALNQLNEQNKKDQELYKLQKQDYESKISKEFEKERKNGNTNIENNSYVFHSNNELFKGTIVQPKKVTFNIEKLEERLEEDILNSIVKKQYRILDYSGMVEYLKSLGAKPKDFKKFIFCDKEVDQKKVDELSDLGKISEEDIEGCYTVSNLSSYVKITRKEIEDNEE